mgnify:CR=1 FL=1
MADPRSVYSTTAETSPDAVSSGVPHSEAGFSSWARTGGFRHRPLETCCVGGRLYVRVRTLPTLCPFGQEREYFLREAFGCHSIGEVLLILQNGDSALVNCLMYGFGVFVHERRAFLTDE